MATDRSRARGAMLAAAYGDALGWPIEDRGGRVGGTSHVAARLQLVDWVRREGGPWAAREQSVNAGEYSDDTQLILAAARSLEHGEGWLDHLRQAELPAWNVYERGGGGATKRAAKSWFHGRAPWQASNAKARRDYFAAGGNGTAMRCLPYAIRARDTSELAEFVDADGISTHGHPRALLGARAYAWAAFWAFRREAPLQYGELLERTIEAAPTWSVPANVESDWLEAASESNVEFERSWETTTLEMIGLLTAARSGIAHGAVAVDTPILNELGAFGSTRGAGTVTAAAAVFLATRYATQPEQGMLASAFAKGGDTDTLASMTGGLLGALRGDDWVGSRVEHLQDRVYIERQTDALDSAVAPPHPSPPFRHGDRNALYRWLDEADVGSISTLEPFGQVKITAIDDLACRTQFVRSWRLTSEIGQSLVIARTDKGAANGRPRWAKQTTEDVVPSRAESRPAAPRAGVVLPVFDLTDSADFYERVLGLEVRRRHAKWVSFGWLALELDRRRAQRQILPEADVSTISIRLYMTRDRLEFVRTELSRLGIPAVSTDPPSEGSFCSVDLDGHALECLNIEKNTDPLVSENYGPQ